MGHIFTIRLRSSYGELWRYNIVVECGGFDAAGERSCFASAQSVIAPVGSAVTPAPAPPTHPRALSVTPAAGEASAADLEVLPNTLPRARATARPYTMRRTR